MLASVATASDHLSVLAATKASIATTNSTSTITYDTTIANTIASWNTLSSSIAAAAGKTVTLTLSTPFDMTGFSSHIGIGTAQTSITIVGNGAVFDAGNLEYFFFVGPAVALAMSNVTLKNGVRE
jgi:hypothetical protein